MAHSSERAVDLRNTLWLQSTSFKVPSDIPFSIHKDKNQNLNRHNMLSRKIESLPAKNFIIIIFHISWANSPKGIDLLLVKLKGQKNH